MALANPPVYIRLAIQLHLLALVILLLYFGRIIFIPLTLALLIAMVLFPLTEKLEKWHCGRFISTAAPLLLFLIVAVGVIYFFSIELSRFLRHLPELKSRFDDLLIHLENWSSDRWRISPEKTDFYLQQSAASLKSDFMRSAGPMMMNIAGVFLLLLFLFIFTFFLIYYRNMLQTFLFSVFPQKHHGNIRKVAAEMRAMIGHYVLGLFLENSILFVLSSGLLLAFGIKYALLFGLFAALFNIVPYVGIYSIGIFATVTSLINKSEVAALETACIFIFCHLIDANIVLPKIVGNRISLNPFITFLAMITGELIWGIPGIFLFIPMTAILKIIVEKVRQLKPWALLIGEEK